MNSERIDGKENGNKYPCLMISDDENGCVITLFEKPKCGTAIYSTDTECPVGAYSDDWTMEHFQLYNGAVKISNEKL